MAVPTILSASKKKMMMMSSSTLIERGDLLVLLFFALIFLSFTLRLILRFEMEVRGTIAVTVDDKVILLMPWGSFLRSYATENDQKGGSGGLVRKIVLIHSHSEFS